jgi:putative membrane protein
VPKTLPTKETFVMIRSLMLTAAASLALAACASTQADMEADAAMATGDMTPTQRGAYVEMAAASDLFEIQSGQMAASKAQRADVRQFAQMLVQHHQQTTAQLAAAASAAGTPPTPDLMPMQARMMDELRGASGAEFDRVFLRQQVQAHEMALALHTNYGRNGDTAALRVVANAAAPIVRQHLDEARRMTKGM